MEIEIIYGFYDTTFRVSVYVVNMSWMRGTLVRRRSCIRGRTLTSKRDRRRKIWWR